MDGYMENVITETDDHWGCMIEWAKKQHPESDVSRDLMLVEIGQDWTSESCDLCGEYLCIKGIQRKKSFTCLGCPLYESFGMCTTSNVKNYWGRVEKSRTWGEWVVNAEAFRDQIKSLIKTKEEAQ